MSASADHTLRVCRLADGACLQTFTGHNGPVWTVVDVGGGRVASGGQDSVLRVWDVLSGKQLQQTPTAGGEIWCATALWGDRVATGHIGMKDIQLWSLGIGGGTADVLQGHTKPVWSLAVVGGGTAQQLLASSSHDRSVRLWDVDAVTCTAVLNGHTDWVRCLADLGGGRLLSGSDDRSLRVWNTATGACLAVLPNAHGEGEGGGIWSACALPGGAATGSRGSTVRRWKWDEGASALTPDGAALRVGIDGVWSLAAVLMPHGALQLLAAGCIDGSLRVISITADGALEQQATALAGHSGANNCRIRGLVVMMDRADCGRGVLGREPL